jgi:hypothetical protein
MKFRQFRHGHERKPIPIKKTSFKNMLSIRGTNFIAG